MTNTPKNTLLSELIVGACNAFNAQTEINRLMEINTELLMAAKDMLSRFQSCIGGGNGEIDGDGDAIKLMQQIISKAEGK